MDLSLLDRPTNVTEIFCATVFCVPPERVEAALQSQTDRISRFVCFLTFSSVSFVIESRVGSRESREEHGNFSPHVEGKTGLRPGIINLRTLINENYPQGGY